MKNFVFNIFSRNNLVIILITTSSGALLQGLCKKYQKTDTDSKDNKFQTIINYFAKHGLKTGLLSGTITVIVKELPLKAIGKKIVDSNEVPLDSINPDKPKSFWQLLKESVKKYPISVFFHYD